MIMVAADPHVEIGCLFCKIILSAVKCTRWASQPANQLTYALWPRWLRKAFTIFTLLLLTYFYEFSGEQCIVLEDESLLEHEAWPTEKYLLTLWCQENKYTKFVEITYKNILKN